MDNLNGQHQLRKGTQRLFTLMWFFWVVTLLGIASSSVYENIQASFSDPVFFKAREYLKRTPPISPRLKIFGLDDRSIGFLGAPEIDNKDLSLFLANIARQKPKAILFDKLFAMAPSDPAAMKYVDAIAKLNIPVYNGLSLSPTKIRYREESILSEEKFGLKHFIPGNPKDSEMFLKGSLHNFKGYKYGYNAAYEGMFRSMGHIAFDRVGSVYPVVVAGDRLIPHLSMYSAESIVIKGDSLWVNDHKVPLTDSGAVVVNHRPPSNFYTKGPDGIEHMKSLEHGVRRARAGEPELWINEGDVVVVLFNFYTGSTDFLEEAPFGNLPGGLLVSTLVDSVLENRWITPLGRASWLILILSLLGVALARSTGLVMYWAAILGVGLLYFAFAIYLFAYKDTMLSWVLPLCGLVGAGTIQYVKQRLGSELKGIETENQLLVERALRLEEEKTNLQLVERLNLGRAIQQILLPPLGAQDHGAFSFAMSYIPNQEMSGDWVYVWEGKDGEKRVIIGDVVGKGPSAAIPVAILIGILGECEKVAMDMEETFHYLNRRIIELFGKQVTCSASAIVMKNTMEIELYNAGSPGWFFRGEGKARHISMRSSTLGMSPEAYFAREKITLTPGCFLFTFTDGYMEGARSFRRLITKLGTMDEAPQFSDLQVMLDEVGKSFRLEDDRSLLMVKTKTESDVKAA